MFLIEVATYPERRVGQQLTGDLMLVYLDRGELPEAVTFVLQPKGKYRIPRSRNLRSRRGLSSCHLKWRVVELWTIPAAELLEAGDVSLIPWVPLTDCSDPPEKVMERCRDMIEQNAPPGETENLLAVTQVLTYLRYNDVGLLTILGGRKVMLESPLIDDIVMEKYGNLLAEKTREAARKAALEAARKAAHRSIITFLETRFGAVPRELADEIESVADEDQLQKLVQAAASCPDLEAFRDAIERR